jgi:hypothetical protein
MRALYPCTWCACLSELLERSEAIVQLRARTNLFNFIAATIVPAGGDIWITT